MGDDRPTGRKEVIAFLQNRFRLPPDQKDAWQKIGRWMRHYGLNRLIHHDVNSKPYVIPGEWKEWDQELRKLEA